MVAELTRLTGLKLVTSDNLFERSALPADAPAASRGRAPLARAEAAVTMSR